MKTFFVSALFVFSLACHRRAEKATAAACQPACERVGSLQLAKMKSQAQGLLHEMDEKVDRTEEESGKNIALLKQELAQGTPRWNPKPFQNLPAATRRELAARHAWEQKQLRNHRELALRRAEDDIVQAKKEYEAAKVTTAADLKKANADAIQACLDQCLSRTSPFPQCLQRVQALEDLQTCAKE